MSRSPRAARVPLGLLGMIGLVALVEGFVARHDLEFSSLLVEDWRVTTWAARREAPGRELLCFGDSLVKYGVIPPVVEAGSGRKAYNLAVNSGGAAPSYFLLRRALGAGARPSAVLVDFASLMLGAEAPKGGVRAWSLLTTWRDAFDLARTHRDPDLFAVFAAAKLLPSARDRFEIRANVLAALRGESTSIRASAPIAWRHWRVNRGGHPLPDGPWRDDGRAMLDSLCPATWRCDPVVEHYIRKFLDLAASRGIVVFWLIPPSVAELEARRERAGVAEAYTGFVRGLQARYPRLVVLDGRGANYPPEAYGDPVHLHRRGAAVLSADVADVLARDLDGWRAGPRWVRLPAFRERPAAAPFEDYTESTIAVVRAISGVRR